MKLMVISGRGFLPERLTRLLMIDAVQSERLQNLVYPQYIAILLCIVILVHIAVKVANDQRLVVFEVWRILIYDLLRNLGIELLFLCPQLLRGPYSQNQVVVHD